MSNSPKPLSPSPSAAEVLGLPLDLPVPQLLGSLATRVEESTAGWGPSLTLDEKYAGILLTARVQDEASQGVYLPDVASQDAGFVVTHQFGSELNSAREEGITDLVIAANVAAMESPAMQYA